MGQVQETKIVSKCYAPSSEPSGVVLEVSTNNKNRI